MNHKESLRRYGSRPPGRLRLPFAATRPQPPELALPGEDAAGARSRPPSLGKLARRPGESGRLTHNTTQS